MEDGHKGDHGGHSSGRVERTVMEDGHKGDHGGHSSGRDKRTIMKDHRTVMEKIRKGIGLLGFTLRLLIPDTAQKCKPRLSVVHIPYDWAGWCKRTTRAQRQKRCVRTKFSPPQTDCSSYPQSLASHPPAPGKTPPKIRRHQHRPTLNPHPDLVRSSGRYGPAICNCRTLRQSGRSGGDTQGMAATQHVRRHKPYS